MSTSEAANRKFTNLKDIHGVEDKCSIKVKIIVLWKSYSRDDPRKCQSIEMVFMDENGDKMLATVRSSWVPDLESLLAEDCAYVFSNFGVASLRPDTPFYLVDHKSKINFFKHTSVEVTDSFTNPDKEFNFVDYQDVFQSNLNKKLEFDVIGQVVSSGDMKIITRDKKETRVINCSIQNLRGQKMFCSLWDSHALKLQKYIQEHVSNSKVVILLQLSKWSFWDNSPGVSNSLFGSRLYINEKIPPIQQFIESLDRNENDGAASEVVQLSTNTVVTHPEDYYKKFEFKHIDEVLEVDKPSYCVIVAKVLKIEHEDGWYYWACRQCTLKVAKNPAGSEAPYYCGECKKDVSDVFPKMKLYLCVQDDTGVAKVTIFERELVRLINKTSSTMVENMQKASKSSLYLDEFNVMLDKLYVFKLVVSKLNVEGNYDVYIVNKFTCDEDVIKAVLQSKNGEETISSGETPLSMTNVSNENNDSKEVVSVTADNGTPVECISSSGTTPRAKRSIEDDDQDLQIQSSTTKSLPFNEKLKIPKLEKE